MKKMRGLLSVVASGLMAAALCSVASARQASGGAEWPQWRGPNRDGVSKETGLLKQWPEGGPPLVWKAQGAGIGYSSLAVANGRVYTMGLRGEREYVIAFDAATGKELWATPNGSAYRDSRGDGPRGTPTVDGERLYALGGNGDLSALDAKTGKVVWAMNVLEKFGASNIGWGISESPLVLGDKLLINPGGRGASLVALDKRDGRVLWKSASDKAGYSSAIPVQAGGKTQVVFFTQERAVGVDPADGKILWEYAKPSNDTANVATPVARGNRVFISSDYGTGGGVVEIKPDGAGAREVYFTREMRNHHSTSILIGEHLYGFSGAVLTAMRFDTGEIAWKDRSVGKGSLAYADGMLYALSENGVVGLIEATPAGYKEKGRFSLPDKTGRNCWVYPVVANGRLYVRNNDGLSVFELKAK